MPGITGSTSFARSSRQPNTRLSICRSLTRFSARCSRRNAYRKSRTSGFFRGSGGQTSEQWEDSRVPHAYALVDANGRIVVLTTHNTDFGDAYEREADDPEFFYRFSVEGYAIGINILLYAMTH